MVAMFVGLTSCNMDTPPVGVINPEDALLNYTDAVALRTGLYISFRGNVAGNVTGKVLRLIKAIGNDTLSVKEIMERLNLKGDDNFRKVYLNPAIEEGYVLRTEENKLRSPNQKYYLSNKGKALL